MNPTIQKTKPSFLEAGLPCSSLSAECQRDNNARQRPPQNRLHIWWARRPPTICRAAILAGLLPHYLELDNAVLPPMIPEPTENDLEDLSTKLRPLRHFFEHLLSQVPATSLTRAHQDFLRSMGITGDVDRAYRRLALAEGANDGKDIILGSTWGYRHQRAFGISPSETLIETLLRETRSYLNLPSNQPIVILDGMAGGGVIPLEGIRYGFKVFANDLNPVAATILKATTEYPAHFGESLSTTIEKYAREVYAAAKARLLPFFPFQPADEWWLEEKDNARRKFSARSIVCLEPAMGVDAIKNTYLWCRTIPCPRCSLNIPLSTNFYIVKPKGKPQDEIAAFPEVPPLSLGNDCTFRIVKRPEWEICIWPKPGFTRWHPNGDIPPNGKTPRCDGFTFKDGNAYCPRCGHVIDGEDVKASACAHGGGLAAQMYAVCSQVPVRLTYRNGDVKVRYLWRFRPPTQADLDAVKAAEVELARLLPQWEAKDLIPTESMPENMEDKRPREYGMSRWRDLFLPRQLLTNVVILEEIWNAQERIRAELPADKAEAVSVYLALMLSKVLNYNSVNTFWHYGRKTVAQTFSRHDFAFRPAFCEFEGARETVMWGAFQVIDTYEALAGLIHGEEVNLEGADDEELGSLDDESSTDAEADADIEGEGEHEAFHISHLSKPLMNGGSHVRPEVIVPTVTCDDAAALAVPAPGTVHLICVDPPYYNNVQYAELSNFFYVWMKRALRDIPSLIHLFREPLAESTREAVANDARWRREAEAAQAVWRGRYACAFQELRQQQVKVAEARVRAAQIAGAQPPSAKERAHKFYEDKMAAVFRRARQLLHPAGRMVVMFNHKETMAWSSLGMALVRAGFEVRSSAPIHTEAESSLNIRGLDAARSTVLLLCLPREEREQPEGNWLTVRTRVHRIARAAAERFQSQGLTGTDLYLSALGPALGEVGRNWPVTDYAGHEIALEDALDEAYKAVGSWRLEQILAELTVKAVHTDELMQGFTAESVDRNTQTLWLWLDTFQGEVAGSDDVRKLARSLNVNPDGFKHLGLLRVDKDTFVLQAPPAVDLKALSRKLLGLEPARGRTARQTDTWEERVFPGFIGAACWNAISIMMGTEDMVRGPEALRQWLRGAGYGTQREFRGAFLVTLHLLEAVFRSRRESDLWYQATLQARRAWDLVLQDWRG